MPEPKLKPCPFCGKIPNRYVKVRRGMSQDHIEISVLCADCDIKKNVVVTSGLPFEKMIEVANNLVKDWNTRAIESEDGDSS